MVRQALLSTCVALLAAPAIAGPVVCTTTLEAPLAGTLDGGGPPIQVTRCNPIQTTDELIQRRAYSWTSPFARGIDITHQITDILGIAMGGGDGTKVMGLGFPDQTIVWDGSAIENTYHSLLDEQSSPLPRRVADLESPFSSSMRKTQPLIEIEPVRGLW